MRILFVDDDPDFLAATKELLATEGYDVIACATKEQASEVIQSQSDQVDIALFDMLIDQSPDAGLRLTRELAARNPQVPIVVLTGVAKLENAAESMAAGAFGYVPKEHTELLLPTLKRAEQWRESHLTPPRRVQEEARFPLAEAGWRQRYLLYRSLSRFHSHQSFIESVATSSGHAHAAESRRMRAVLDEVQTVLNAPGFSDGLSAGKVQSCRLQYLIRHVASRCTLVYQQVGIADGQLQPYGDTIPSPDPLIEYMAAVTGQPLPGGSHSPPIAECDLSPTHVTVKIRFQRCQLPDGLAGHARDLFAGKDILAGVPHEARLVCFAFQMTALAEAISIEVQPPDTVVSLSVPLA